MSAPSEYAREMCLLAAALLQQAEATGEVGWMLDAIDCYQAALEADPELLEPYLALAWLWLWHGQSEMARPFLRTALQLAPFDEQVQSLWAEVESGAVTQAPETDTKEEKTVT